MKHPKILIVYYSRTGTTRAVAAVLAEELGCDIESIVDLKTRLGLRGWIACVIDSVCLRTPSLAPNKYDPSDYDLVLIGSPIWAFTLSAPVRSYLKRHAADLPKVAFFVTCAGLGRSRVFEQMSLLARRTARAELVVTEGEFDRGEFLGKLRDFARGLAAALEADAAGEAPNTEANAALAESA